MEDEALERRPCSRAVFNRCKQVEGSTSTSSSSFNMEQARRNGQDEEQEIGPVRVVARRHRLTLFSIQLSASIVCLMLLLLLFEAQKLSEVAASPAPPPAPPAGGALAYDRLEPAPGQTSRAARQQQLHKLLEAAHGSPRLHQLAKELGERDFRLLYPVADSSSTLASSSKSNQSPIGLYNGTNVVIKAFNHRFSLDFELNSNLFKDNLIQKHILPNGVQVSDSSKLQHCYYHARTRPEARPQAIGAFRTCQPGLSGIIHLDNETFVIHPFYETNLSKKHPHIIYRYQPRAGAASGDADLAQEEGGHVAVCGNTYFHELALRRFVRSSSSSSSTRASLKGGPSSDANAASPSSDRPPLANQEAASSYLVNHDWQPAAGSRQQHSLDRGQPGLVGPASGQTRNRKERDYRLATEKYIELALVLGRDMVDKRNTTSPLEVLHDALQIVNCLDLYFRSANTRVALIYIETWPYADQIDIGPNSTETLLEFQRYSLRQFWHVGYDAAHLLTGLPQLAGPRFSNGEIGMSWPASICTADGVSVSEERSSLFEPFLAAATMAHMLGHNLDMKHESPTSSGEETTTTTTTPPTSITTTPKSQPNSEASSSGDDSDEEQVRGRSVAPEVLAAPDEQTPPTDCPGSCLMNPQFNQIRVPLMEPGSVWQQQQVSMAQVEPEDGSSQTLKTVPAKGNSFSGGLPFRFSKQSLKGYHRMINTNKAVCLFNQPGRPETFQNCGNGIVEPGEDCDCGSAAECLESPDDCCDRITCRFKPDVQCISGTCCERCRLKSAGSVCRRARSDCDLAEVCDGKSNQCGPDLHKLNGHPCHNDTGYCYLGQCPSHGSQCRGLWGQEASEANQLCYAQLNSNGTHRGNCGSTSGGSLSPPDTSGAPLSSSSGGQVAPPKRTHYKRCEPANIMCGTLQCQLGDMRAVIGAPPYPLVLAHSLKNLKSSDGAPIECKALEPEASLTTGTGQQGNKIRQLAYVRDGTKCGPGSVCFNQSCQLITSVFRRASELCPRDEAGQVCSGNGLCSSAFRCHCNPDWLGHDCSQRAPARLLSSPAARMKDSGSMKMLVESPLEPPVKIGLKALTVGLTATLQPPPLPIPPPQPSPTITPQSASTTSHPPPPPPPPQTGTQSANSVTMEKTSEAIGAPTLVFILVSIVAAVYVGFALMANCYRRKGFLKPDKVLRHHQMNCKLDAIRSSFIAKRLADAANGFGIGPHDGAMPGLAGGPGGRPLGDEHIGVAYGPFSSNGVGAGGFSSSHLVEAVGSDFMQRSALDQVTGYPSEAGSPPQHPGPPTNLMAANVHYFKQPPQGMSNLAAHSSYRLGPPDSSDDIPLLHGLADQSQHHQQHHLSSPPPVPPPPPPPPHLLMPKKVGARCSAPTSKQMMQQPFGGGGGYPSSSNRQQAPQCDWTIQRSSTCRAASGQQQQQQAKCPINRTTSLGNVNNRQHHQQQHHQQQQQHHHQHQQQQQHHHHHHRHPHRFGRLNCAGSRPELVNCIFDGEYESEDEPTARLNHRALATPCRRYSAHRGRAGDENCGHLVEDSCSTPSSPERRHKSHHHWIHSELDHNTPATAGEPQRGLHQGQARPTSRGWHPPNTSAPIYQADVVQPVAGVGLSASWRSLGAGGTRNPATNDYGSQPELLIGDLEEALPAPPPPLDEEDHDNEQHQLTSCRLVELDREENSSDLAIAEDLACNSDQLDSDDSYTPTSRARTLRKRRSVASSDRTAASQQAPSGAASPWRTGRQVRRVPLNTGDHQTLVDQLEQLDQVKQASSNQHSTTTATTRGFEGSLDEFLALPLPVQISALLSRQMNQQQPPVGVAVQSEDIGSNLEESSTSRGATRRTTHSSQTVKKYPDEQVSSNTDSMKRQQIKLHTLQTLINRLQRLHSKTVLECQMDELGQPSASVDSRLDDESELVGAGSRHPTQTAKATHRSTEKMLARRTIATDSSPPLVQSPPTASSSQHLQTTASQLKFQSSSSARPSSRQAQQEARNLQFDEQTSFPTNNDSTYSMSDSEEAGFVSRMLISTYQQVDVQTSSLDTKRATAEEKHNKQTSSNNKQHNEPPPPPQESSTITEQHQQQPREISQS